MTIMIICLLCASFSVPVVLAVLIFRDLRDYLKVEIAKRDDRIRDLKDQLTILKTNQTAMVRRIVDWSQKHNQLATVFEEHGHGLLDEDTMQPMAHSTTPVSLVEILQRLMSQAHIEPGVDVDS